MHESKNNEGWSQSKLQQFFSIPIPGISRIVPIFGGRSFFELILAIFIVILALALGFSDALLAGKVANFIGFILAFMVLRKNFILDFFAISLETSVFWHKFFAILMLALVLIHAIGEKFDNASGIAMFILVIITSSLYLFTFVGKFNYFYFPHVVIFGILIPLLFIHGAIFFGIAGLLWIIDRLIRYSYSRKDIKNAEILQISESVFRVSFQKSFDYKVAQFCFLRVKGISDFDYHPFTISSCPSDPQTTFHIKRTGHWTKRLSELGSRCDLGIEGPYGHLSIDLLNSKTYPVIMYFSIEILQ
jgi:NADPH oxidase